MNGFSEPRQLLDDIGLSLVFFTRLRLPSSDFGGRSLADSIWAAPFAGFGARACRDDACHRRPA